MTSAVASRLRARLATTCPARTDELTIGIDRNRSTMPLDMSVATATAVVPAEAGAQHDQPGRRSRHTGRRRRSSRAEDVDEQQHQDDGQHQRGEERLGSRSDRRTQRPTITPVSRRT